ncbi:ExbD/TolR family protein [Tundrisphaera lichenicola]|uniref:ExbD/TolR family protein n=1 Tax=Tundrisphaera lichenicola TaxID=2029860 RepID=UPI003EBDCF70
MIRRLALLMLGLGAGSALADEFEQLDGPMLTRLVKGPEAKPRPQLTFGEIGAMPALLRDSRSALVLATTDRGNPARLLLSPELRKPASGVGEPIPVLVLERLDTFDAAGPANRLASRRDLVVFDGFQVDLESGQVVPEGQGGDLVFRASGEVGPRLEPVGPARLFTLDRAPQFDDAKVPRPTPGRRVVAADFAGRYRLFANGQWSGTLDLRVEDRGVVRGQFRSDLHGSAYPVTGQVAADVPQLVRFSISFPRARQEFEGYLWGEGKGAMAGTASLLERTFGFFALREGAQFAPDGQDLGPVGGSEVDRPGRHVVEIRADGPRLDGEATTLEALVASMKPLAESGEAWVLIRIPADRPFGEILPFVEAVRASGVSTVRLEAIGTP